MDKAIKKYVLYGASFNPPHIGHFSAISQMLEEYDKVIVFPYPKKYKDGVAEKLPAMSQRMKMLKLFFAEFFPQVSDRLLLNDLSSQLKLKDKIHEKVIHTYDYLKFVQEHVEENVHLSVCLGFDATNAWRKESFHKEEEIRKEFGVFTITEENQIKSDKLREFFSNHRNVKSAKDEQYIRYAVGNSLAEYIFENNLYGLQKKKILNTSPLENGEEIKKPKRKI